MKPGVNSRLNSDDLDSISIRFIEFGSLEYADEVALRDRVLRRPIGFTLSAADTEFDVSDLHIGAFKSAVDATCDVLVGCCLFRAVTPAQAKMRQVAVDSSAQGLGVGSKLVAEFEKLSLSRGHQEVVLDARKSAIDFYLRLGYEVTSELFMQVSVPHNKMRKYLV